MIEFPAYRGSAHYSMCCQLWTLHTRRKAARVFPDRDWKRAFRAEATEACGHVRRLLIEGDPAACEAFAAYRASGFRNPPNIP